MIPSANTPIRPIAPPVNMFSMPPMPVDAASTNSLNATVSIPGTGM